MSPENREIVNGHKLFLRLEVPRLYNKGLTLRYLFDLSTLAQWHGPAVGVVRVEQELARRARQYLGDSVAFGLYHRSLGTFVVIDDEVAGDLIKGQVKVDLGVAPQSPDQPKALRKKLRAALLRSATAYHLSQILRGRGITREQVLEIQTREIGKRWRMPASTRDAMPLTQVSHYPARLDSDTWMISAGLDWQYKDLRALWNLKQLFGFSYCAVIYDLIPVRYPHLVVRGYDELLTDYFGELLWVADLTMCISNATREDWVRHAHEVGVDPKPSFVFPLGCDLPDTAAKQGVGLPSQLVGKRFVLYVSTIEPRKNHWTLYQAWEECVRTKQINPDRHRLVFVGRRGWATEDLLREISVNPATRESILVLHDLSDDQLAALYRNCAFTVFPSLYEGYGLPLAEALSYGKLCISSGAAALAEVGSDLVIKLDPRDTMAWSELIGRFVTSPSEVSEWESRVARLYQPTTWDAAANSFFSALKSRDVDRARNGSLTVPVPN